MTNVIDMVFLDFFSQVSKLRHEAATQPVRTEAGLNPKKSGAHQALSQCPPIVSKFWPKFSPLSKARAPSLRHAKEPPRELLGDANSWIPPPRIIIQ